MWTDELKLTSAAFRASYCGFVIPACYYSSLYLKNTVLPIVELGWVWRH